MTVLDEMSIVRDVSVWQMPVRKKEYSYGKYKNVEEMCWHGYVEIDQNFPDAKSRQIAFDGLNAKYKLKWMDLLKTTDNPTREQVHELQDWHARELRILSGRDPLDAKETVKTKKLDIIKLAEKFDITPGELGWETKIASLVEQDLHTKTGEEDDTTELSTEESE